MKRSKFTAILAAGVLTLGVSGVALASTSLLDGQVGKTLGEFNQEDCDNFPLPIGPGEIGVHFVLNQTDDASGNLDATFSTDSFSGLANSSSESNNLHWYAVITGDLDTTIDAAETDADGGNLVLSHVCPGSEEASESPPVEESFEGSVEELTEPPTDTFGGNGTSGPADGAWLLVVALGVLLASIVVLTPARAQGRR